MSHRKAGQSHDVSKYRAVESSTVGRPCGSISRYEKLNRIGEGTYGVVYRARDRESGEIVALKRIRLESEVAKRRRSGRAPSEGVTSHLQQKTDSVSNEGFPVTALREITLLQKLKHVNVISLRDVVVREAEHRNSPPRSFFLVFDYCENDLARILDDILYVRRERFREGEVKSVLVQILQGLHFLHSEWIIHRDLKLSNILYNNHGEVKLADFGLARAFGSPLASYTPRVVTLWYRAPELLLQDPTLSRPDDDGQLPKNRRLRYATAPDLWAVGCIFGELLLGRPMLPGRDELDQLHRTFALLGTPTSEIWPAAPRLLRSMNVRVRGQPYNRLRQVFRSLNDDGVDLLDGLLAYDPQKRYSAKEALEHRYLRSYPKPTPASQMPTFRPAADSAR